MTQKWERVCGELQDVKDVLLSAGVSSDLIQDKALKDFVLDVVTENRQLKNRIKDLTNKKEESL